MTSRTNQASRPANVCMRFGLKLGILITLLTLLVTGGALAYFYNYTKQVILEEMQGRLSDLAHTGTYLFREDDRELITLFQQQLFSELDEIPAGDLEIPADQARSLLTEEVRDLYHDSYPFQHLVQLLRQVQFATSREVRPPGFLPQVMSGQGQDEPQIQWSYLVTRNDRLKDHGLVVFLVDTFYKELEGLDQANPIGTAYAGDPRLFQQPFEDGNIAVSDGWYTDQWGTIMTAVVPVKNDSGEVIAALGLDYSVGSRADQLDRLFYFCISLFGVAFVLALVASFALAGVINVPISRLRRGAERFGQGDFSKPIRIRSRDEFGVLASTLNTMAHEIHEYSEGLEKRVDERTRDLARASDEILELNERLRREKDSLGAEVDIAKGLQQLVLPGKSDFAALPELEIEPWMRPADLVGGDYFDVLPTARNRAWIAIGDVTGHGLESGVMMLMMRTAIRASLPGNTEVDPEHYYGLINRIAYEDVQRLQADKHMTLSLLHYAGAGTFTVTGQHQDLLVVRDARNVETLDTTGLGLPVGLIEDISEFTHHLRVRINVGQSLVLYTNGITDAENVQGEPYGLERLLAQLRRHANEPPQAMREAVVADVVAHTDGASVLDDMTLLIVKRVK